MYSEKELSDDILRSQFLGFLKTGDIRLGRSSEIPVFEFPEIDISEELIEDLRTLDHPRNSVLGKRMESFFEIAIKHSRRYDLIASNIQIIHDKTTIGELDFILYDHSKAKPLHVELVYKIYVYDSTAENLGDRWIGPNRKDSFSEKMAKLTKKQLPLLYRQETKKYLEELGLKSEDIEQQLCYKAQLYCRDTKISEDIISESMSGTWITYNEFIGTAYEQALFWAPKKNAWSSLPADNQNWITYTEILEQIESLFEKAKSPLIWMKSGNEFRRFFVVWW